MFDLFSSFFNLFNSLVNFIISSVESLFTLISNIPVYLEFLVSGISYLPSIIIPFAVATISLYVVLFIIGR